MIKKLIVLLFAAFTGFVYASSYSLQIIQHDEMSEKISSVSYIVEDQIMDYFFNTGNIISNTPAAAVKNASEDEHVIDKAIMQALDGYCDVMIAVTLEYSGEERFTDSASFADLEKMEWFIMDLSSEKKIADGSITNKYKNGKDTKQSISKLTYTLSKDIVSCLGDL